MIHRNAALRLCLAIFVVLTVSFSVLADTVRLKDGSIIKGRIVSFGNGRFVVVIGEGTTRRREMTFDADEVESIQFESSAQPANVSVPQVVNTSAPRTSNPRVVTNDTTGRPTLNPAPTTTPQRSSGGQPITLVQRSTTDKYGNPVTVVEWPTGWSLQARWPA